jgi:hypothetical protein
MAERLHYSTLNRTGKKTMPRLIQGLLLLCALWGCVMPESVTHGDKSLAAGDSLKAIQLYEQALQETTDGATRDKATFFL